MPVVAAPKTVGTLDKTSTKPPCSTSTFSGPSLWLNAQVYLVSAETVVHFGEYTDELQLLLTLQLQCQSFAYSKIKPFKGLRTVTKKEIFLLSWLRPPALGHSR